MDTFLSYLPTILDELLRHDGLREHLALPQCASCLEELGEYKCIDCASPTLYCTPCIVSRHADLPLHRLEVRPSFSERHFLTFSVRFGTADFLRRHPSVTWVYATTLVTRIPSVLRRPPELKSLSSTSMELIVSTYNSAHARRTLNGLRSTPNFCV